MCSHSVGLCKHGGIAECIFDLSTGWRCVVSFMPQLFYSWGKIFQYPRWAQNGYYGEQKNLMPYLGFKPLFVSHLACNIVTILTVFFKTVMCFSLWALFVAWHILTYNSVVMTLASIFCAKLSVFSILTAVTLLLLRTFLCFV